MKSTYNKSRNVEKLLVFCDTQCMYWITINRYCISFQGTQRFSSKYVVTHTSKSNIFHFIPTLQSQFLKKLNYFSLSHLSWVVYFLWFWNIYHECDPPLFHESNFNGLLFSVLLSVSAMCGDFHTCATRMGEVWICNLISKNPLFDYLW